MLLVVAVTLSLKFLVKDLRIFALRLIIYFTRVKSRINYVIQFGIELIKGFIICHFDTLEPRGQLLKFVNFYYLCAFMHSLQDIPSNVGKFHIWNPLKFLYGNSMEYRIRSLTIKASCFLLSNSPFNHSRIRSYPWSFHCQPNSLIKRF